MFSPHCCGIYSLTGALFTSFVYAVLLTQPFFVSGVYDIDVARTSALGSSMAFAALFGACMLLLAYENFRRGHAWERGHRVGGEYEHDEDDDDVDDDRGGLNIDLTYVPKTATSIMRERGGGEGMGDDDDDDDDDALVHDIS
ncbi:hypothetical protein ACHAXA_003008 [Cyclostephanos tholiformis]|uniref:Uncharacterized protein n=1 Tax=Cyclostephanos tholiformis TaxID=382380 RepID=A0ABD3SCE5_9STRA